MRTFDETRQEYSYNGKVYRRVTQLLAKHGLAPDYSMVDPVILQSKAEFGRRIHKQIELYIKGMTQKENLTEIALSGVEALEKEKIVPIGSEYKVWLDKHEVAGTIDIIGLLNGDNVLVDIKTTYVLNKSAVAWQLGFYALLSKHYLGTIINKSYVLWLNNKKNKFELIEVEVIPEETILELLRLDEEGKIYGQENENQLIELNTQLSLKNILYQLEEAKAFVKHLEEQGDMVKAQLKEEMIKRGIKSFEDDDFKITYVAPQERVSYNYKQFLEDKELEITDDYKTISNVKDSIRITIKESK